MQELLNNLLEKTTKSISSAATTEELNAIRVSILGRKSEFTEMMRGLKQLPASERPAAGQMINAVRSEIETALTARQTELSRYETAARLAAERIDITLPTPEVRIGMPHPMHMVAEELTDVFAGMGFETVEGPEVEYDRFNFELLNIPKDHPARDMHDTFYINSNTVLRTHTSPVQARTMLERKPPIRIICPGRVYRADEPDATHTPVFHQMEGLMIDKDVTMGDLKGTLDAFARHVFGSDITTRFRPSYFPFTEPSAEVDLTCTVCRGNGCRVCSNTGWIEILGAGMVNPKVLDMCGIDSKIYSGFAFGLGLERITMLRYGMNDGRAFYEGDLRLYRQFY